MCVSVHGFRHAVYDTQEDGLAIIVDFRLNVVGTTGFSNLTVGGTITAEAVGTASKE